MGGNKRKHRVLAFWVLFFQGIPYLTVYYNCIISICAPLGPCFSLLPDLAILALYIEVNGFQLQFLGGELIALFIRVTL